MFRLAHLYLPFYSGFGDLFDFHLRLLSHKKYTKLFLLFFFYFLFIFKFCLRSVQQRYFVTSEVLFPVALTHTRKPFYSFHTFDSNVKRLLCVRAIG